MINKFLLLSLVLLGLLYSTTSSQDQRRTVVVPIISPPLPASLLLYDYYNGRSHFHVDTTTRPILYYYFTGLPPYCPPRNLESGCMNKFIISNEQNNQNIIPASPRKKSHFIAYPLHTQVTPADLFGGPFGRGICISIGGVCIEFTG